MTRPDHEIDAYFEGQLTAEGARALDAWITADPANAGEFLQLVRTHQMLIVTGKEQLLSRSIDRPEPQVFDAILLESLVEMEATAEPLAYRDTSPPVTSERTGKDANGNEITLGQALDDLRWAMGKVAYRLIRSKPVITSAISAMLLVGLYVFGPWQDESTPDPLADQPDAMARDEGLAQSPLRDAAVARLTAEHNAQWSGPGSLGLATGDALAAGQRLNLTAGFAEITTARGAVAILEAPATIELLDNDNAVRLHTGKLVGICETDSSKGFVVKTDQMNITDLGTRFGVAIDNHKNTLVEVSTGSVAVDVRSSSNIGFRSKILEAGQSDAFDANGKAIRQDIFEANTFARLSAAEKVLHRAENADAPILSSNVQLIDREDMVIAGGNTLMPPNSKASLYKEFRSHKLGNDLPLTLDRPGKYFKFDVGQNQQNGFAPKGAGISSYVLGFHPVKNALSPDNKPVPSDGRISGYVVFETEILGVIANAPHWEEFVSVVGNSSRLLSSTIQQMLESGNGGDWVEIGEDRRTLRFNFTASSGIDSVRIIVREPQLPQAVETP